MPPACQQPLNNPTTLVCFAQLPCTPSNSLVEQAHTLGAAKTRNILQYDLSLYEKSIESYSHFTGELHFLSFSFGKKSKSLIGHRI
jgi:hypothetical protein